MLAALIAMHADTIQCKNQHFCPDSEFSQVTIAIRVHITNSLQSSISKV